MASTYNPYSAINAIYNYKSEWDSANKSGDTQKKNKAAENAKTFYDQLRSNGYGSVADQLSSVDVSGAKYILDQYSANNLGQTGSYDPYSDIQKVYNAKVAWNQATTDDERNKQNEIATAARKTLETYGYGDVANQISANGADATAVRKILEQYSPTAPSSTTLTNSQLITTNNNETRNKINQLWGTQMSDRATMATKYNKLEDTAYSNPFETDEAKAILSKYDLAALNGRNNAVASGGASNGGNIDSYAAANALRQQSALVNQGQMAVLDAHNNKINNVKGILESLGIYQQNQDKGMQTTIGLQSNEGQRLFENEENARQFDKTDATKRYEIDKSLEGTKYVTDKELEGTKYVTDKEVDTTKYVTDKEVDTTKYVTDKELEGTKYVTDKELEGTKYVTDKDLEGTKYVTDKDLEGTKYVTDKDSDTTKYTVDKSASPTKPTLTASQAATAIKNGEISQDVIDAYNYYYGTNYTVQNPPKVKSGSDDKTATLSEKEVKEWVDYFNNFVSTKYGSEFVAFEANGKNKYKRKDLDADKIIIEVLSSDDLTDEQKEYLLIDKLGITENEINTAIKDQHYR